MCGVVEKAVDPENNADWTISELQIGKRRRVEFPFRVIDLFVSA